jgi:hypothetical protein
MDYLVRPSIAGNAKKMQNSSPRDFSATAGNKNSRLVPKLVLRHALFGNTLFGSNTNNLKKSGKFCIDYFYSFPLIAQSKKNNLPQERKGLFIKLAKSPARYFSRQQKKNKWGCSGILSG